MSMTPPPRFFFVEDDYFSHKGSRTPWADGLYSSSDQIIPCDCKNNQRYCEFFPTGKFTGWARKGSMWPDMLAASTGGGGIPVSFRVWSTVEQNSICKFVWLPIEITQLRASKLVLADQPSYRMLRPEAGADLDIEGSYREPSICEKWWKVKEVSFDDRRIWKILPDTWNRAHLFTLRKFMRSRVFCTPHFIELAREHRWTNFKFIPALLPEKYCGSYYRGVDYLGKKWPPPEFDPDFDASKWTPEMDKR